jgi:hypothetical protein
MLSLSFMLLGLLFLPPLSPLSLLSLLFSTLFPQHMGIYESPLHCQGPSQCTEGEQGIRLPGAVKENERGDRERREEGKRERGEKKANEKKSIKKVLQL